MAHHHRMSLLGNLVTIPMQVKLNYSCRISRVFGLPAARNIPAFHAKSGMASFSFTLEFHCTIPMTKITER